MVNIVFQHWSAEKRRFDVKVEFKSLFSRHVADICLVFDHRSFTFHWTVFYSKMLRSPGACEGHTPSSGFTLHASTLPGVANSFHSLMKRKCLGSVLFELYRISDKVASTKKRVTCCNPRIFIPQNSGTWIFHERLTLILLLFKS